MKELVRCPNKPENPAVFKDQCPAFLGQIKVNNYCLKCSFNPSFIKPSNKPKPSKKAKKTESAEQGPWREEAVDVLTNPIIRFFLNASKQNSETIYKIRNPYFPYFFKFSRKKFNEELKKYRNNDDLTPLLKKLEKPIKQGVKDTDKHFQKIEKIVGPSSINNVRELVTREAEYFLALREQWKERSRKAGVKRQIQNVERTSKDLFNALSKLDDDARLALSGILQDGNLIDSENPKNPVSRIRIAAVIALKELPPDKGGSKNPWEVIPQRIWFREIQNIWTKATEREIDRNWQDGKGACGPYKKVVQFFQLLWQPLNPEKEITMSIIDGKIKDYLQILL